MSTHSVNIAYAAREIGACGGCVAVCQTSAAVLRSSGWGVGWRPWESYTKVPLDMVRRNETRAAPETVRRSQDARGVERPRPKQPNTSTINGGILAMRRQASVKDDISKHGFGPDGTLFVAILMDMFGDVSRPTQVRERPRACSCAYTHRSKHWSAPTTAGRAGITGFAAAFAAGFGGALRRQRSMGCVRTAETDPVHRYNRQQKQQTYKCMAQMMPELAASGRICDPRYDVDQSYAWWVRKTLPSPTNQGHITMLQENAQTQMWG